MKPGHLIPLCGSWYIVEEIDEKSGDLKLKKREATAGAIKQLTKQQAKFDKFRKSLTTSKKSRKITNIASD